VTSCDVKRQLFADHLACLERLKVAQREHTDILQEGTGDGAFNVTDGSNEGTIYGSSRTVLRALPPTPLLTTTGTAHSTARHGGASSFRGANPGQCSGPNSLLTVLTGIVDSSATWNSHCQQAQIPPPPIRPIYDEHRTATGASARLRARRGSFVCL
jgi:hypothetical protein